MPARGGSWITSARRNDVELHQQIGKVDVLAGLVDHDAHRAFGGVRADIDQRCARNARRASPGMAISIWPSRIAALGRRIRAFSAWTFESFAWPKITPIRSLLGNETWRAHVFRSRRIQWHVLRDVTRSCAMIRTDARPASRVAAVAASSALMTAAAIAADASPWDDDSTRRRADRRRRPTTAAAARSAPASKSGSSPAGRPIGAIPAIPACRRASIFPARENVKSRDGAVAGAAAVPRRRRRQLDRLQGRRHVSAARRAQDAGEAGRRCGSSSTMRCARSFACRPRPSPS